MTESDREVARLLGIERVSRDSDGYVVGEVLGKYFGYRAPSGVYDARQVAAKVREALHDAG